MGYVSCQFRGVERNVSEIGAILKGIGYMLILLFSLPSNFIREMYAIFPQ